MSAGTPRPPWLVTTMWILSPTTGGPSLAVRMTWGRHRWSLAGSVKNAKTSSTGRPMRTERRACGMGLLQAVQSPLRRPWSPRLGRVIIVRPGWQASLPPKATGGGETALQVGSTGLAILLLTLSTSHSACSASRALTSQAHLAVGQGADQWLEQ